MGSYKATQELVWQALLIDWDETTGGSVLIQSPEHELYPARIAMPSPDAIAGWMSVHLSVPKDSIRYLGEPRRKDRLTVWRYMVLAEVKAPF